MREDGRLLAIRRADNGTQEIHGGVLELDNPLAAALPAKRPAFTSRWNELRGVYGNTIRGIVTLLLHTSPPAAQNALQGSQQPSPDPLSTSSPTARPRSTRPTSWSPWTATAPTYERTTASTSPHRDRTFPTASRPVHGAGARRLSSAASLLSAPRLAAPGGALGGCGMKYWDTLCGWGGRLHGFRQPLWGEPLRFWPQRRALTGRSTDCPTRQQLTGPRSLAPKQLQPKAAPPTATLTERRLRGRSNQHGTTAGGRP